LTLTAREIYWLKDQEKVPATTAFCPNGIFFAFYLFHITLKDDHWNTAVFSKIFDFCLHKVHHKWYLSIRLFLYNYPLLY
jgi:hypothetical protein